jgi:hypothetical protein
MTKLISITTSHRPEKKYDARFSTDGREKTVSFGAKGMDDYTKTHSTEQRERYRTRHRKDLETHDPTKAGYLSWHILWGQHPSLRANIEAYRRRFGL